MGKGKRGFKRFLRARLFLLVVLGLCLIGGLGYQALTRSGEEEILPAPDKPQEAVAAQRFKRFNFLLLGSDARYGEINSRCDSIIFVSADTGNKRLVLLSIPRDTLVEIPGYGEDRINATMAYGGPELAKQVVSDLIGQPIDYYVVTNYEGFIQLVDALGGVTLEVDKNMYHYDPERGGRFTIRLKKGLQHLDGERALMYVRYRGDQYGDINRIERQQRFLGAIIEEMLKPRNLVRLPVLIPKIKDCIYTDLPLGEMISLARMVRNMDDLQVISGTLPGYFAGDPYWHVDPDEAKEAVAQLLMGEPITRVVKEPPPGVVIAQVSEEPAVATEVYPEGSVLADTYGSVAGDTYHGDVAVEILPGSSQPPETWQEHTQTGPATPQEPSASPEQPDDLGTLLAEPPGETATNSVYNPEEGTADSVYDAYGA